MKFKIPIFLLIFGIIISSPFLSNAQDTTQIKKVETAKKQGFVDKDGDGYNDNAPDHDGDGIPNGLDPDWKKLKRGKGEGKGKGKKRRFIDLDGDGINDNIKSEELKEKENQKKIGDNKGSSINETGQKQKRQKRQGNRR
jgi:hypothetical protein